MQRPARTIQDVGAQLSRGLLGIGRSAQRSILGKQRGRGRPADRRECRSRRAPRGQLPADLTCWFHQCAPTKPAKRPNCSVSTSWAPPAILRWSTGPQRPSLAAPSRLARQARGRVLFSATYWSANTSFPIGETMRRSLPTSS